MTPLLRASATCVDDTVLVPVIERGSTTPETDILAATVDRDLLFAGDLQVAIDITPTTVVVMVPVKALLAVLSPLPCDTLPPLASVFRLALAQLSMKDGAAAMPRLAEPLRLVLVATFLDALVRSLSTIVTMSPTLRGRRSSNSG